MAALLEHGYDVYGVDVDPVVIESAKHGFPKNEFRFSVIPSSNQTIYDNHSFHFIISEHVIEHVEHVRQWVDEITRLIKPNGYSYHVYPPFGHFIKPHLSMPFIHYLPAGRLRRLLLNIYVSLGVHPKWIIDPQQNYVDVYDNYLTYKVHHKPIRVIIEILSSDFNCELVSHRNKNWLSTYAVL